MANLLETLAESLARDALQQERITGDEGAVDAVAKSLADTSTTFQEAFLTAIRYYRAEARARELLPDFQQATQEPAQLPPPMPAASRVAPADPKEKTKPEPAPKAQPETRIVEDEEEIPYAEAEMVEEEPASTPGTGKAHVGTGRLVPKPKVSAEEAETPAAKPEVSAPRKAGR